MHKMQPGDQPYPYVGSVCYLSELNDTVELHRVNVLHNLGIVLRILRIPKLSRQSRDCVTHVCSLEIV